MSLRITILGTGALGTILSQLLVHNNCRVKLWGARRSKIEALASNREQTDLLPGARVPDQVELCHDDHAALRGADLVFVAVPTQYLCDICHRLAPHWSAGTPTVIGSKGIEVHSLRTPEQVLRQTLRLVEVAALSGPNIASEIAARQPASAVVASRSRSLASVVQRALSTPWFRVYTCDDLTGVEIAGAVKNVIALAAGMCDGLRLGVNAKAALITRGLVELTRLGVAMGASARTFSGLAGLGDLVTTCISPAGRNRAAGQRLGEGRSLREVIEASRSVIEGIPTARAVLELSRRHHVEMPITRAVCDVLDDRITPAEALRALMSRDLRAE